MCLDVFFQIKKEFFEFIQFLDFQLHFCVFIFLQKIVWFVLTRLLLIVGMSNCTLVFYFEKFKEFPIQQKKNSSKLVALLKRYRAVKLAHFFPATVRPMGASDWLKVSAYAVTSVRANHSA